jgi:alpha/beta superfamily hydrolase
VSIVIPAGDVQLEVILREPQEPLQGAVVVCHPHPVYGGTMDNKVVYRSAKAAVETGLAALRFNFRGVGRSTGQFDQGLGEQDDTVAAIDWLEKKYPDRPLALMGYSFGSWVGLRVGCLDPRITAMVALAPPLNLYDFEFLTRNEKPTRFIVGTRDEFCSIEKMEQLERKLPSSSSLHRIDGAEHFFTDHIEAIQSLIRDFFRSRQPEPMTR